MFKVRFPLTIIGLLVFAMQPRAEVFTVEIVTDVESDQVYSFKFNNLIVQPSDTVMFVNRQEDFLNVVFEGVTEAADIIESRMLENVSETWSYTFSIKGTCSFHYHPHAGAGISG